jgi:quercetin dioxygenase-like cupin family protein
MRVRTRQLVELLGTSGAIIAWLAWFEIAPALGFPTIGPAAMLNRVFLPGSDPGVWLGWVLMALGLIAVAALYALAMARGWIRPGVVSGLLFGLAAWAIAGMVLMVIIGRISPPPPAPPAPPGPPLPTTPDPMHATFLMLHLGALAPVGALVAWLLFGAVVGATSVNVEQARALGGARSHRGTQTVAAGGVVALVVALVAGVWIAGVWTASAPDRPTAGAESRILATGPAQALPEGPVFLSVIELRQAPGATLGPHAHVPGFAYVLEGLETISFAGETTMELDAGHGGFMGALAIHSHENRERAPAAVLAAGLLAVGLVLSIVSLTRIAARQAVMAVLAGLFIVAGAVALWDPWANDWFFIGVRPEAARGGVMPLPNASRNFESPNLESLPTAPYTESLRLVTVPPGAQVTTEREPGPEAFLVLSGQGAIRVDDSAPKSLETTQAALAQLGASVQISNPGEDALSLLSFSVVASGEGG